MAHSSCEEMHTPDAFAGLARLAEVYPELAQVLGER